jgi:hypothetical protein
MAGASRSAESICSSDRGTATLGWPSYLRSEEEHADIAVSSARVLDGCAVRLRKLGPYGCRRRRHNRGVLYNGGPPQGLSLNNGYQPGDIELIRDGSVIVRRHVREGDPYGFAVSPGEYTVRVRLGDLTCSSRATVRSGQTTKADVLCSIK